MTILHTVNRSPIEHDALSACLRRVQDDAAILLYEDGVYGALEKIATRTELGLSQRACAVYVLQPDFDARGLLRENMLDGIASIDYVGFVQLCTEYDVVQAWS